MVGLIKRVGYCWVGGFGYCRIGYEEICEVGVHDSVG